MISNNGGKKPGAGRKTRKTESQVMYLGGLCVKKAIKIMKMKPFKDDTKLNCIFTNQQLEIALKVIPKMFPQAPLVKVEQHTHYTFLKDALVKAGSVDGTGRIKTEINTGDGGQG